MKHLYSLLLPAAFLCTTFFLSKTTVSQPVLGFTVVSSSVSQPVDVVAEPGSNRMFVVQQNGIIRIVDGTTTIATPYLNIAYLINTSGSERGLLSLAFHPDYLTNGYLFVYYTNLAGDITIARYSRDELSPDSASVLSGVVLLTIPKPFSNHNGGKLNFGPDGKLYFATGDGGDANDPGNNAQSGSSLLGKMIRLDVENFTTAPYYSIPADNPFTGASPIRDEVFALGLRNPWRWSFDRSNGDIWIADVGQDNWEEVNHLAFADARGANYGWRCIEGTHANPAVGACTPADGVYQPPIFEYTHSAATGGFAITGGYVYHGSNFPSLNGYYVTADYSTGNVWLLRPDGTFVFQDDLPNTISSFGESNSGELYAVSHNDNTLYSISVAAVLPVTLVRFSGSSMPGYNQLSWSTALEENLRKFVIEYSVNGGDYLVAGELAAANPAGSSYSYKHYLNNTGLIRYRLRMEDIDQSKRYSPIISISTQGSRELKIFPTMITNDLLQVVCGFKIAKVDIIAADGRPVYSKDMNGSSGYFSIPLPALQKGMYFARFIGEGVSETQKIFIQ